MKEIAGRLRSIIQWSRVASPKGANRRVRDFIYLNVPLVSSFLEQLGGSLPHTLAVSSQTSSQGGTNTPLVQFNVGQSRSYTENHTIYWRRYDVFEDMLRQEGMLNDLRGSPLGEQSIADIRQDTFFLAPGYASMEPDWSNWGSLMEIVKYLRDKSQEMSRLQHDVGESTAAPRLFLPGTDTVISLSSDPSSQVFPENIPDKPPEKIRGLFKPEGVKVCLDLPLQDGTCRLQGVGALEHFTPHRVDTYIQRGTEQNVSLMGLTTHINAAVVNFTPIAIFVDISGGRS